MSRYILPLFKIVRIYHLNVIRGPQIQKIRLVDGAIRRNLSSIAGTTPAASFEDVEKAKDDPNTLIIDVREPHELQETGVIPGSINIPLGEVESSFKNLSSEEFRKRYGLSKPEKENFIIFSCRSGRRSEDALQLIKKLGYKNLRNFEGGWLEWEEKVKISNK